MVPIHILSCSRTSLLTLANNLLVPELIDSKSSVPSLIRYFHSSQFSKKILYTFSYLLHFVDPTPLVRSPPLVPLSASLSRYRRASTCRPPRQPLGQSPGLRSTPCYSPLASGHPGWSSRLAHSPRLCRSRCRPCRPGVSNDFVGTPMK